MIPIATHIETSRNLTNLDSYTTASFTPTAGCVLIVDVKSTVATGPINTPTLSGLSLSFTEVASIDRGSGTWQQSRFIALVGGSPATGVITIDFAAQIQRNCEWSINELTNCLTTGTNGADAIVQTKTGASGSQVPSYSLTFDATWDDADNRALAAFSHDSDTRTFIAGTNFAILGQVIGSSSSSGLATEFGRDSDDVVDIAASAANHLWTGIISEIAGGTDTPPPPDPDTVLIPRVRRHGFNHWMN